MNTSSISTSNVFPKVLRTQSSTVVVWPWSPWITVTHDFRRFYGWGLFSVLCKV